jgi:hypothetical protein
VFHQAGKRKKDRGRFSPPGKPCARPHRLTRPKIGEATTTISARKFAMRPLSSPRPAKSAPFFLNFSYVCPEPVLTKDHFQSIKWLKKGVFRTEASVDGLACQELQENGLFLSFPYVCPEPVLVK